MGTGINSKPEYEVRMRKARFWGGIGQKAILAFGVLICLMILTLVVMKLLPILGKSVASGLLDNFIFVLVILLIISSLIILVCNFLRNLYQRGNPCNVCNALPTNCSECGFQKPTRLESEKGN